MDDLPGSTSCFRLSGRLPSSSTRRRPVARYADSGSIADRPKRTAVGGALNPGGLTAKAAATPS